MYCFLMHYQCCSFHMIISPYFIFVMVLVNNQSHLRAVCLIGPGFVFSDIVRVLTQEELLLNSVKWSTGGKTGRIN